MTLKDFHVVEAKLLGDFRVALKFRNGKEIERDLSAFITGPVFEPIMENRALFESMKIDGGTLCWENGADIDPLVLYWGDHAKAENAISNQTGNQIASRSAAHD